MYFSKMPIGLKYTKKHTVMVRNILKHSYRIFVKQKGYAIINIFGLTVGIASSLIIALFVIYELSYDTFNDKKDRIYQLVLNFKMNGPEVKSSSTCMPAGPTMLKEFPEVEDMCRVNIWNKTVVKSKEQSFTEKAFALADSTFFNIFSVKLILGDKRTVLDAPHKMVLSKSTATKFFGREDPIGKTLQVSTDTIPYTITGVMEDVPRTSHFDANIIGSLTTSPKINSTYWTSSHFNTYILLKPNANPSHIDTMLGELVKTHVGGELKQYLGISFEDFHSKGNIYRLYLQPLTNIHLNPEVQQAVKAPNNPKYLWIFGSVAILIILIASINYMNLSTAQSSKRAKEIGFKKVCGSSKGMLIGQFIAESILLSFISLLIAIVIVKLSLPLLNNILQLNLELNLFGSWVTIPSLIILSMLIGFIAGSYPAFYLSSFSPNAVLKGIFKNSSKSWRFRNVMVVLQFTISIMFITGTIIMFRQINFMQNKDLGFSKEHLIVIDRANAIGDRMKTFKETIGKIPDVVNVSASTDVPFQSGKKISLKIEGRENEPTLVTVAFIDYDFFKTFGMKFSAGRSFDETHATDKDGCILNESAVKQLSITSPLTTRIVDPYSDIKKPNYSPIIGVVSDFHFESFNYAIKPYMFLLKKHDVWNSVSIRLSPSASGNTINEIEKVWKDFTANDPMQFNFMDKYFEQVIKEEKQRASLAILFTLVVIFIALLGLFGLTSFTVEQRTKEIGVRKAMGATVPNLFILISKEIVFHICISTLIAWPIVYFISRNWLQNYSYRIHLSLFDFFIGFIVAIAIALITISNHVIKAARVNPSDSLRYE
ncbi:MAG: FtsX-like permease family protein [Bacteroidales bacterium]|nr:MAG: FtsX-like permease family protein [Bacteroidales bacterium]